MKITTNTINRLSAWVLMLFIILYIVTGFAMIGKFGVHRLISVRFALWVHTTPWLYWPLIVTLLIHCGICIMNALKRWRVL